MKKLAVALASAMMLMPSLAFANGSSEKTPPQSGPVQLTLWHRWSGANADYLKQVVDAFEAKHPDIEITVVAKPGEYIQLLQAMVADLAAGNNPPDMFVGGYNMLNYVANELEPTQLKDLAPSPEALNELKSEKPRAVITGTDLAARKFVPEGELAFAVTGPEFDKMLAVTEECFFHSPVWKPVRNRLRREEHLEDAKFTGLA